MKSALTLLAVLFVFEASASTSTVPNLFVQEDGFLISVQGLIDNEEDVQSLYGFENFCYKGNVNKVSALMQDWADNSDLFFSGGGGGFVLSSLEVLHGIATYDIRMTLEDEVVPGEFRTVFIRPCQQ